MDCNVEKLRKINCIFSETAGLYHKLNVLLGLSDSVSDILYLLYASDGCCSVRELCTSLDIPKQTVNSALRGLERDGILFLEAFSGKKKRAILTQKGKQFCEDTVAPIFQIENSVFAEFSASEIEAFIALHEKYNAALAQYISAFGRIKNGRKQ